nr:hypothetical protein [Tanacetum cinerariifolium]
MATLYTKGASSYVGSVGGGESRGNGGDGICGSNDDNRESGDGGGVVTQYAGCGGGVAADSSVLN